MSEPNQAIEKKVRQILRAAAQKEPPTDLERVLAYLRIHHERPWHFKNDVWEGLARPARGRTRITGQERAQSPRGRWRLAHEIAHHVLHGAEPHLRAGTWETHELELEADQFAAALLMPPPWLEKAVKQDLKAHDHLDIDGLAHAFRVGTREMEMRLRQLGLMRGEVLGRM